MNLLQALILGIAQGLTEFIPVSSSGHLVLLHEWFGVTDSGLAFDVALHGGTLLALLIYFYADIKRYVKALFKRSQDTKIALYLAIATVPAAIFGYALESLAETVFRSTAIVAFNLFVVGLIMLVTEKIYSSFQHHTLEKTTLKQAIIIGVAQSLAIVPGVSRSGSTIVAGMLTGFDRVAAARFSFLLGIPIIGGALAKVAFSGSLAGTVSADISVLAVGVVAAFMSGLFAISFMLKFLNTAGLQVFAYYRMALAAVVLLFMAI